jgi:anti-anti-sigma regulatory factor
MSAADLHTAEAGDAASATAPAPGADWTHTLPAELTIFSAAETREALLDWLARTAATADVAAHADAPVLRLDAQGVVDVDGAGVQLLCSLGRQAERDARRWQLVDPSGALQRACEVLGLGDWLSRHSAATCAAA